MRKPPKIDGHAAKFRVYPGRGNLAAREKSRYWQVYVFPDLSQLRRGLEQLGCHGFHKDGGACTACIGPGNGTGDLIGFAMFSETHLNTEIVSHEAAHMASHYVRRMNPKSLDIGGHPTRARVNAEERIAYAVGCCCDQLVRGFEKRLYREAATC